MNNNNEVTSIQQKYYRCFTFLFLKISEKFDII